MGKQKYVFLFIVLAAIGLIVYYFYQENRRKEIAQNAVQAFDIGALALSIKIADYGLGSFSEDIDLLNIKGKSLSQLNEHGAAIEVLTKSLKIKPDQKEIQIELSECLIKKSLEFFVKQDQNKTKTNEVSISNNLRNAAQLVEDVLKVDKANQRALNSKGLIEQIYFEQKKEKLSDDAVNHLDEALKSFRAAYQSDHFFVEGMVNQAILLYTLKKTHESEQLFVKCAKSEMEVYESFKKKNNIPNMLTESLIKSLSTESKIAWINAQNEYTLQFQKILFFLNRIYSDEQNYAPFVNVLDFQIIVHDIKWQTLLIRQQLAKNFTLNSEIVSVLHNDLQQYIDSLANEIATYKKQLPERIYKIYMGKAECYSHLKEIQKAISLYQKIIDQTANNNQYQYYFCKASLLLIQIQLDQENIGKDEKQKYIGLFKSLPNMSEPQLQTLRSDLLKKYPILNK